MKRELRIIETKTSEVVKAIDVTGRSDKSVETIQRGAERNLNHERFHVDVVDVSEEKKA